MATWWHKAGQKCDFFSRGPDHRNISPSGNLPSTFKAQIHTYVVSAKGLVLRDSIRKPTNPPN